MRLIATVGAEVLTASLNDSPPAQDFVAMLPMTLDLRDFRGIEKIADLSRSLSIAGAPKRYTPGAGDITDYAPWGNLALFFGGADAAAGLLPLGRFEGSVVRVAVSTAPLRPGTRQAHSLPAVR